MGSVQKIKLGINGLGRFGRLVASEKQVKAFGVKSSEEIGVFNGHGNSTAQSKVINSKNTFQSGASIWKTVHGLSMNGCRNGQLATFCTVPDNPEITEVAESAKITEVAESAKITEVAESAITEFAESAKRTEVSDSAKITEAVENLQPAFNGEEIENDTILNMIVPQAGPKKITTPLFPFSGSDLLYLRDGTGLYNNLFLEEERLNYIKQLRKKCWNMIGKSDKMMDLVEKCIAKEGPEGLSKALEMMIQIVLRSKNVPHGCNTYLNEVRKMRTLVSENTNTKTSVETIKLRTIYQSASWIAQDICAQLKTKTQFRIIFNKIIREIPIEMKNGVEGIRVTISGRINGAEIARTECGKYGKTSRTTFSQKVDFARAEVITRSGLIGVKVWISYRKQRKERSSPSVEV